MPPLVFLKDALNKLNKRLTVKSKIQISLNISPFLEEREIVEMVCVCVFPTFHLRTVLVYFNFLNVTSLYM